MSGPVKVDVLVVGSGAAGLSAAVTAAMHGASVMVAEKASVLGGTSAWSGGWLWIPRNPLARAEGIDEAADAPLTYLQHEMGGEAADIRLQTFLRYGPEMVEFFHQRTAVQFLSGSAMPDFHPSPGAANGGRSVTAQPYDGRLLGDWLHRLRPPLETISLGGMGIAGGADMAHFFNATRSPRSALYAARRLLRHGWQRLRAGRGQHLVNGNALVARLLRSALDAGVRFQLNAPVVRLLQGPPGVSGAVLRSDGGEIHVEAGAVVLACGGFPHDRQRLAQVVPHAAEGYGHFSAAPPDNQGEGIRLGESVGGQFDTSLRHPLAWAPVSRVTLASGQQLMFPHLVERAKPGVIAVLPNGKRFVNEADSLSPPCWRPHPRATRHRRGCWPIVVRCVATAWATPDRSRSPPPPGCVPAICSEETPWRSWRSSALSTPMRWRKPLNALTTSPALAKTSIFTAGPQPITAPRVTIR